jgi:prephenate dehydratase/chorismate mutase/prephenate dehydratase
MNLNKIRKDIDLLDSKILKLLNDRMELALMSKKFKSRIEDGEREKEVLSKIRENSTGLINAEFIEKIYTEIIKESKNLQQQNYRLIAFQGDHGAYGEEAARKWKPQLIPMPCREFVDVFEGVENGLYAYGIVPVENTLGGVVGRVNQLLIHRDLRVAGAVELPIQYSLLVLPGTDHRDIRLVYSHPQALARCRGFLSRNKLEPVPYAGSASAAKMLVEKTPKASAVIASNLCAELYDLVVIKEDIENRKGNTTRFLVLSAKEPDAEGNKCSVIFSTEHRAGTLFGVLELFAKEKVNLTRIGSIPNERGTYVFFLDFMGSSQDDRIKRLLEEVKGITTQFKLMGCYKEAKV